MEFYYEIRAESPRFVFVTSIEVVRHKQEEEVITSVDSISRSRYEPNEAGYRAPRRAINLPVKIAKINGRARARVSGQAIGFRSCFSFWNAYRQASHQVNWLQAN